MHNNDNMSKLCTRELHKKYSCTIMFFKFRLLSNGFFSTNFSIVLGLTVIEKSIERAMNIGL